MIAFIVLFITLLAVFMIWILIVKIHGSKKEHRQAKELSRFMGYVCEANERVLEVNLNTGEYIMHNMEEGELVSRKQAEQFKGLANTGEFIHPDDLQRIIREYQVKDAADIFRNIPKGLYFEARSKRTDGSYCWYSYTIRPIPKDKEHPNNFMLFQKNIDKVKQEDEIQRRALEDALENAKHASMAKGQFLSRMSHEIRTPLNAVIGYMNIARDSQDNPAKVLHCVENSDTAAKHLLSIINDVLDISSIESGKMKIAHEEFDLKKQISTITTLFYNQAKEKKVQFEVQLKDVTEEWVIGDSLRVNQILMNLLSNAMKFTPEGGLVELGVTQMKIDDTKVYMKFIVRDSGIGMSEEYQQKLFQPFEQESDTTAQKYGGTGLGLSIMKNLVTMMGGSVKVESKVGEGTTFTVSLHFDKSREQHMMTVQHDYSHVRALIVDDDQGSCEYMQALLERCKVQSDVVNSGKAAIRQMRLRMGTDYSYNLCLLDWNMPDISGVEVAKKIKQECKVDIPIVIATAYDVTEFEEEAKAAGVDRVIAKPLFQSTMFDILVSTYGRYEPEVSKLEHKKNLEGLHVLLAEDNEMNAEIAVEILTKAGIQVDRVADGQQAVDSFFAANENTYDLILMDVQMPVLNGYEATGVIRRSKHPKAKTIPIIAMTANAFAEDVTAALASGMDGHIAKPIDYDKLYATLDSFGKGKH